MRTCIFGAGAVGGFLAARLAQAGRDVSVIARGEQLAAIRARGLRLVTPGDAVTVRLAATSEPADLGPQDLVIVTAKTPALPAIAGTIAPLLGPETLVAFAVNGVFWFYADGFAPNGFAPGGAPVDTARLDPGGVLHRQIGAARALGIVVYSANEVIEPGVVRNKGSNSFTIGEVTPGATPRAERVAAALAGPDLRVEATADIRRVMWQKLVDNVGNSPIAPLTGGDVRAIYGDPAVREIALALKQETIAVARAHGFAIPFDLERARAAAPPIAHKPSILQDLERGRKMEIDSQLAIVQDFARQSGVATPMLDVLLPLVIQRARLGGCYEAPPA